MTVSKIRFPDNTEHDIRAKYLIQSSSSDAVSEEFVTKTTTEDAIANIQKIYGNTIKFNQLIKNGNFADSTTNWSARPNISIAASNNVLTVTVTTAGSGGDNYGIDQQNVPAIASHKYLIRADFSSSLSLSASVEWIGVFGNTALSSSGIIVTANNTSNATMRFKVGGTKSVGNTWSWANIQVFDLTQMYGSGSEPTVSEFESEFNQPYYDYNPSGLLSVKATAIQSKDSSNNVIGNCDLNIPTLTGKLNGAGSSVVIFPDGMGDDGTNRDELTRQKVIKKVGILDLGSITWAYSTFFYAYFPSDAWAKQTATNSVFNGKCALYTPNTRDNVAGGLVDKAISVNYTGNIVQVRDTSYSDPTVFRTAMNGVKLVYELATPQEYNLDNALQLQYPVVAGGTEMVLPTTGTALMKMDVIYGNAADAAATMSQNYISVDSMKEFLAALGTQMGGTWSMGYEDGKHTFTFTSN